RRAAAPRDRRQSVLPHVDAPGAGRRRRRLQAGRRDAVARSAARVGARAPGTGAVRCPPYARRRRGAWAAFRLRDAGGGHARARGSGARCARDPRQAAPVARGARGRLLRFQPRQGARGGVPGDRRRAPGHAAPRRRRGARAARPGGARRAPCAPCRALRARPRLEEGIAVPAACRGALHWLDRAVALAEAHPDAVEDQVELYARRGSARAQAGQTEGAVSDIRQVIEAAQARGEREKARDAVIQLGMAYRRADDYERATQCLTQALAESRAMRDERHAADTLYHLGTVAWSNGRNREAIGFHAEAVAICERLGLADLVAVQAYHGRGEAHHNNAEPAAAIVCYERSLELARRIGDKSYECENLMMVGYSLTGYMGLADYPRARAHFEASLEIARKADLQWHMGPTLLGLDHLRACAGEYAEALAGMTRTLRWLESLKQIRYQLIAYDLISHLLLDSGAAQDAAAWCRRGL